MKIITKAKNNVKVNLNTFEKNISFLHHIPLSMKCHADQGVVINKAGTLEVCIRPRSPVDKNIQSDFIRRT